MQTELETDVSGLKSAYEKTRLKLAREKEKNAELERKIQRMEEAFDCLAQAVALRNPAPPCSN